MGDRLSSAKRMEGRIFIRKMLDAALQDAPDDVYDNPLRVFDTGNTLLMSQRMVRAIHGAGYRVRSMQREWGRAGSIRRRLELEDLIDTALVAAGAQTIRNMEVNDQARDTVAQKIWDTFHQRRVVLERANRRA